ncbi:MAG: DNA primase [Pseudomonadales bacterium]|jgi:DNA primase|nr:DNA primase [Pseudomonadales bacterium]
MAGIIPQRFIDDLLGRVDIVDVVSARVKLRKTGKNYSGLCPFHQEKSPSFTVQPEKQFYYCFGCGAGGNAIGFVMDYENLEFPAAVELLAREIGIEVPREERGRRAEADREHSHHAVLLDLLEQVNHYFQRQLRQHAQKQRAVDYLKKRGLSGEVARDFGLGYAPPGWRNLLDNFGDNAQHKQNLLEAGLLIENPDNARNPLYDRFRDRIMYPIRNLKGRVIGFGGRVLGDDKPKYLNSPETPVFRKGEELYGLYEARRKLRQIEGFLLVEGYMDVIALAQSGIHYAVATLGTATSATHLRTLFKYTNDLIFCFDGDNAGREAAWRALQQALPLLEDGRSIRFLFLPEGQDPDTQVRAIGKVAFEASLKAATRMADFLFDTLAARLDIESLEGKARLAKLALPLLQQVPKGVFSKLLFDQLDQLTGMATSTTPAARVDPRPEPPPALPQTSFARGMQSRIKVEMPPCIKAVNLLIRRPALVRLVQHEDELAEIRAEGMELLLKVAEIARLCPDASPVELMSRIFATAYGAQLTSLLGRELLTPEDGMEDEFKDLLAQMLHARRQHLRKQALVQDLRRRHLPPETVNPESNH